LAAFAFSGFFRVLYEKSGKITAVKKGTSYLVVNSGKLKFLDWLNFNPNCSLRSFLKSVFKDDYKMQKSYFPYEAMDSFDALSKPLPEYDDFRDRLSGTNALNADYEKFQSLIEDGYSEQEAVKSLGLNEIPKTGMELYQQLMVEWKLAGYETLGDICRGYIVLDTKPLLHGKKDTVE
jgi:hypothetical protein